MPDMDDRSRRAEEPDRPIPIVLVTGHAVPAWLDRAGTWA
jgi:hypothetical protein